MNKTLFSGSIVIHTNGANVKNDFYNLAHELNVAKEAWKRFLQTLQDNYLELLYYPICCKKDGSSVGFYNSNTEKYEKEPQIFMLTQKELFYDFSSDIIDVYDLREGFKQINIARSTYEALLIERVINQKT